MLLGAVTPIATTTASSNTTANANSTRTMTATNRTTIAVTTRARNSDQVDLGLAEDFFDDFGSRSALEVRFRCH